MYSTDRLFRTLLAATLAFVVPGRNGHAQEPMRAGLLACTKLADKLERLSCYDRLADEWQTDPAKPPAPTRAPDAMFGMRPKDSRASPGATTARTELPAITAHLADLHESPRTGAVLTLDNGQKWQQTGHEELSIKVGDEVTITRGAFESFWLKTPGNRFTHVKRLD